MLLKPWNNCPCAPVVSLWKDYSDALQSRRQKNGRQRRQGRRDRRISVNSCRRSPRGL